MAARAGSGALAGHEEAEEPLVFAPLMLNTARMAGMTKND